MRKIYVLLLFTVLFLGISTSASADRERGEHLIAFDRALIHNGANDAGQTPREVANQIAVEFELGGFKYVPDIGFVAEMNHDTLDKIVANPDVNTEFECQGWICTCQGAFDCAWLSYYCSVAGGISGFDDECYLP